MKLGRKEVVIFDLSGTPVGSIRTWKAIDIEYLVRFGLTCLDGLQKEVEGTSFSETTVYFKEWFQLKETLDGIKNVQIQMSIEKYRKEVPLKPGAEAFLGFILGKGLVVGIATNNGRVMVDAVLDSLDTRRYSKVVVTVCEVAAGKPAPDIYLNMAERLQVASGDCVVLEDVPAGIQAGRNAGVTVFTVGDIFSLEMKKEREKLADYYIRDYYELLDGAIG